MATSSSAQKPRHLLNLHGGGTTAAPPPTPSTQPISADTSAAADTLSRLLHRLPPNLSLPTRLSPRAANSLPNPTSPLPSVSLSSTSSPSLELGYFQLTHHPIPSQLAESAESDAISLFDLPLHHKLALFPRAWPLGFDDDDDDENNDHQTTSFCLDGGAASEESPSRLASLRELSGELEKLGLQVVDTIASSVGFENPFRREGGVGPCCLMWVSDGDHMGRVYPYAVGLQYQIRPRKWSLLSDSGSVDVEPQVGSVLVTLGDIAQVWSNGKLKKVRGRAAPISEDTKSSSRCVSMTLLLTLPLECTVLPLLIIPTKLHNDNQEEAGINNNNHDDNNNDNDNDNNNDDDGDDKRVFNSFSFEDYAWRVYHERLLFKDPLDRYRINY